MLQIRTQKIEFENFLLLWEKIKLFSANNDYAQLFTQVDLDYTHHPLQVVLYFQLILNLG